MKRLLKILIFGLFGILALFVLFIQYLKSDLNDTFNKEDIEAIQLKIKSAKRLPEEFVKIYNDIDPITSTSGILYDGVFKGFDRNCPCLQLAGLTGLTYNKNRIMGNRYVLSWKLEQGLSQEECLFYLAGHSDFLYSNIGIEKASEYYFSSSIDSLTERQMKTLVLMLKNPIYYNPKINPEQLEKELNKLKN